VKDVQDVVGPVIWSRPVVDYVRGLGARQVVPECLEVTDFEVLSRWVVENIESMLRSAAQTVAADLRSCDIQIKTKFNEALSATLVSACWLPVTREVRLVGGARDGEVLCVRDLWTPLLCPREPTAGEPVSPVSVQEYVLWGWNNTDGVWIYAPKGFSL